MDNLKEVIFAEERQSKILDILKTEKKVLVPQLCEIFDVSPVTIRNDLNAMQAKGLLKRTHGGAILESKTGYEENIQEKMTINTESKQLIAELAAEFVSDGDVIAMDTGTTTLALATKLLGKKNLTVVTNDLNIARFFDTNGDSVTVVVLGGVLRKKHSCTLGAEATDMLESMKVDVSFIAANGLTAEFGISTPDMGHADVKRKLISAGSQSILLCDSSKIGRNVFVKVADASDIDILVTDIGADNAELSKLAETGIEIKIAGEKK